MKLIIDDVNQGECIGYHQKKNAWSFTLENGIEIIVPFQKIKLFTSSGKLEIITHKIAPAYTE